MKKTDKPHLVDDKVALTTAGLVHRVWEPATNGPHRTMVMLHGRKGNEEVMWVFARAIPANWLIVAPRAITAEPDGGYSWHPRLDDEWPSLEQFDEAVTAVARFIRALPELYDAHPDHIYLMGFSQGAATAYATAIRYPGLVQAIAGLVGFMPTESEAALANAPFDGLPVFMAVGKEDDTIPLSRARATAEALRMGGAWLEYREYDTGHKLNAAGMRKLEKWWAERNQVS